MTTVQKRELAVDFEAGLREILASLLKGVSQAICRTSPLLDCRTSNREMVIFAKPNKGDENEARALDLIEDLASRFTTSGPYNVCKFEFFYRNSATLGLPDRIDAIMIRF